MTWEIDKFATETGHVCASCSEDISVLEDLCLLQVVCPVYVDGKYQYRDVTNAKGVYAYDPVFFQRGCWGDICDSLLTAVEDREAIAAVDTTHKAHVCFACGSDILLNEVIGLLTSGDIRKSPRKPNGEHTHFFKEGEIGADIICIACLYELNQQVITMWDGLGVKGICEDGLVEKCWRGPCRFGCRRNLPEAV